MFFLSTVNKYREWLSENNNFSRLRFFSHGNLSILISHPIFPKIESSDNAIANPPFEQSCTDLTSLFFMSDNTETVSYTHLTLPTKA